MRSFVCTLHVDAPDGDSREEKEVRDLVWRALIAIPPEQLAGAIVSLPYVVGPGPQSIHVDQMSLPGDVG